MGSCFSDVPSTSQAAQHVLWCKMHRYITVEAQSESQAHICDCPVLALDSGSSSHEGPD